jgi:hypothetical protein
VFGASAMAMYEDAARRCKDTAVVLSTCRAVDGNQTSGRSAVEEKAGGRWEVDRACL